MSGRPPTGLQKVEDEAIVYTADTLRDYLSRVVERGTAPHLADAARELVKLLLAEASVRDLLIGELEG